MERQKEYELRKKIAEAIQNDVDRVFSEKLQLLNHDFCDEILFPLTVLEMNYKMKSEESVAAGLEDANEYLILVNPLREAIYWYIHKELVSDRKIRFSKKVYSPSLAEEYSFVEYVLQLYDEFKRGEQIKEIRDCASKVMIKSEGDNKYSFHFPVISEKYNISYSNAERIYYKSLKDSNKNIKHLLGNHGNYCFVCDKYSNNSNKNYINFIEKIMILQVARKEYDKAREYNKLNTNERYRRASYFSNVVEKYREILSKTKDEYVHNRVIELYKNRNKYKKSIAQKLTKEKE